MFLKASLSLLLVPLTTAAQPQVRTLSIDELFRLGIENSLRMQASRIGETLAGERAKSARSERLPGLNVGLSGGYLGQPVVFQQGLTQATRPDTPNWSNNYNIDLSQPLYEGGKIRYSIRQADLERQIASLSTENDRAEIKMLLLQQYVALYNLYKQTEVLQQNIDESTRRLEDIRRMRNEGLVTRNDETDQRPARPARGPERHLYRLTAAGRSARPRRNAPDRPRHRIAVHSSSGGELPEVRRTGLCELSGIENRAGKYLIGPE